MTGPAIGRTVLAGYQVPWERLAGLGLGGLKAIPGTASCSFLALTLSRIVIVAEGRAG